MINDTENHILKALGNEKNINKVFMGCGNPVKARKKDNITYKILQHNTYTQPQEFLSIKETNNTELDKSCPPGRHGI